MAEYGVMKPAARQRRQYPLRSVPFQFHRVNVEWNHSIPRPRGIWNIPEDMETIPM